MILAGASEVLGAGAMVYGLGASAAVLLQARQLRRRGTSCDVSVGFFTAYVGGYVLWLLYGLSIASVPIVVVHAVGLMASALTLFTVLSLRGPVLRPASWTSCPA